ncbi:hypothetical protein [Sandaracinobacter neustonicus]|nr:hypothetical protein [Sandaracinobacter neustonicus]
MESPRALQDSEAVPAERPGAEPGTGLDRVLTALAFLAAVALILLAPFGG